MHLYRLKYAGIRVKDMDESLRFYTEVLGMEVVEPRDRTPPTEGEVVTLRSPGGQQLLELNWYAEGSRFGPPYTNARNSTTSGARWMTSIRPSQNSPGTASRFSSGQAKSVGGMGGARHS